MEQSQFITEDGGYSSGGDKIGFRVICLEQYRRCILEGSKTTNFNPYFVSAVKMLGIMILPKFKFNEELKEQFYENEDLIIKEKKEYVEQLNEINKVKKNPNSLTYNHNEKMMILNREKLSILNALLDQLNYFEEETVDSFDMEIP